MKFETCYMCKNGVTIKVDEGFKFLGCLKNKNKWVGEIKKCPINRGEREKLKRKMKTIHLKILKEYADAKVNDLKPFEIRKNDRDYKVGDLIRYVVIDKDGKKIDHRLSDTLWEIVYITDYKQRKGYIVFTDKDTGMPF